MEQCVLPHPWEEQTWLQNPPQPGFFSLWGQRVPVFSPLLRQSPGEEVVLIFQSLPLSSPRYQPRQKTGPSWKEFKKKKKKKKKEEGTPGLDKTREGPSPGVSPLWLAT